MQFLHTCAFVLTTAAACGSQPSGQKIAPAEPPPTIVAQAAIDAAVIEDAPAPTPRLACDAGTTIRQAPAPELAWYCVRADGTRHGPFQTTFPDDTIEIAGAYRDGQLDGAWSRRAPGGAIVEDGAYAAGVKTGTWTQRTRMGNVLGTYTMTNGTGTEKAWYDSGVLYSERALRRGIPHGTERTYAPDGTFVSAARYENGKLDGQKVFGSRQSMRFEESFTNGVRTGKRTIWVQGTLIAEENYDRAGRLDGTYTLWRRARVMRLRGTFDHGKRVGQWTWWDRGNNKEKEGAYVAGERDGLWQEWWEGKLVFSGRYAAGKPDGDFVYFDRAAREIGRFSIVGGTGTMLTFHINKRPSSRQYLYQGTPAGIYQELTPLGKVVVEGRYRNNQKHGTWKEWTADGVPTLEQTWKRGKLHGTVKKYVDGKASLVATYTDGRANGPYTEMRGDRPALTGQFVDGQKDGTWTTYAPDGTVLLVATYVGGTLQGPWRQLVDGAVLEGTMEAGRRVGTWTRTDRGGVVSKLTYTTP
ncbi:MAG: hypothetical protein AB7T06_14495 [Kofleriaceae bacterium]